MKGVLVVLDGVADEPCEALGQATPLQAAKTPNLDSLAARSRIDHCYLLKEGVVPESASALVSLLGYDPRVAPKGALEARGAGIKLTKGDLALRTSFATVDGLSDGNILDSRAGRTLTSKEIKAFARAINEQVKLPFTFEFHPTVHHRGVVVFRGGFSNNITDADPFYGSGMTAARLNPRVSFSKPLDEEDDSKLASDLVNAFMRKSHEVLDAHPLNSLRAKKGLFSANFLLCSGAGNEAVRFKKLPGKWVALGSHSLERGVAQAAKMDVRAFGYPQMKGIDVYDNLMTGIKKTVKHSIKALKKGKRYDYAYIHFKETAIPGHDNKPLEKVKMLELLDRRFFSFLDRYVAKHGLRLVVAAGNTTSCRLKAHTADPVPVLFHDPATEITREQRFTEEQGLSGKKFTGKKLLERTLFVK